MELNPYAAPLAVSGELPALTGPEAIRQAHIGHEATVKSLGSLYFIGGLLLAMGAVIFIFAILTDGGALQIASAVALVVSIALCVLNFWLAGALRKLRPSAKTVAVLLAAIGLLAFPVGTIINAYVLYILVSAKGSMVFSPQYQEVIAATPQVRYRTSPAIYVILGIVLLAILALIIAATFGAR